MLLSSDYRDCIDLQYDELDTAADSEAFLWVTAARSTAFSVSSILIIFVLQGFFRLVEGVGYAYRLVRVSRDILMRASTCVLRFV